MPNFELPTPQTIQFVSFEIGNFVIRICFVFRASNLHFCLTFVYFSPLRLAPWNILSTKASSFHSRHYFMGRASWNTDSTKIELFARSAIPRSSPRGIPPRQKIYRFRREVIPRGKSSFIRFPKPPFSGKFQICWID